MKLILIGLVTFMFLGCTGKDDYYKAVHKQNEAMEKNYKEYQKSYNTVKNESVQFEGDFKGKITLVKPKDLPEMAPYQRIQQPKTFGDAALDWARVLVPAAVGISAQHYSYKTVDSSNKYNAQQTAAYTGSFQNTASVTNTSTDTSVVNTSTDKSTDTSVTNTTTDVSPTVSTTDGTTTTTVTP